MSTAADDMNEGKDEGLIDSDSFEKLSITDDTKTSKCVYCSKPAKNKCSNCGIMYCSHDCQKKDWKEHKQVFQSSSSATTATTATAAKAAKAAKAATAATATAATAAATVDPSSTPPVQFYDSLNDFLAQIVGNNKQTNLTFSSSPGQPNLMYMAITENEKTDYYSMGWSNKKLSANGVSKQVITLAKKGSPPMVTLIVRKIVSQSNPNPPTHHRRNHYHAHDEHYFVSSYFMIFEPTRVVVHKSSAEDTSVYLNTDSRTGEPMPIPDDETYE